ncbi:MAG: hypothetical protein M1617_03230 [Actinobacteria bacterium]|nr:hypothetical protein [Actinomycetota bacterium]
MRVVPSDRSTRRTVAARREADRRNRDLFIIVSAFMVIVAILGVGRITIMAKAAEVTFETARLSAAIREEQIETEALELLRSSLVSPSRIESIAVGSMNMIRAEEVSFFAMPLPDCPTYLASLESVADSSEGGGAAVGAGVATGDSVDVAERQGVGARVLGSVMELAAGEAHALLLGDVGLVSMR